MELVAVLPEAGRGMVGSVEVGMTVKVEVEAVAAAAATATAAAAAAMVAEVWVVEEGRAAAENSIRKCARALPSFRCWGSLSMKRCQKRHQALSG